MSEEEKNAQGEQFFKKLVSDVGLEEEAKSIEEEDNVYGVTRNELIKVALAGMEVTLGIMIAKGIVSEDEVKESMIAARAAIEERLEG